MIGYDKNLTVRVNEAWLDMLSRLLNIVARGRGRDRSRLIRQLLAKEAALWLDSPYVVTRADHFILVRGNGDVFYRAFQRLELKAARARLPTGIEMKPERQAYYQDKYRGSQDPAAMIKGHWLINHFSVWEGEDFANREPLSSLTDRDGLTSKWVDLPIDQGQDVVVTREIIAGFKDYVQKKEAKNDTTDDRGGICIDIPTINFSVTIVVDCDLYHSDESIYNSAAVGYEFRNRESALLRVKQFDSHDDPISWREDRHPEAKNPGTEHDKSVREVTKAFETLKLRLDYLAHEETLGIDGRKIVEDEHVRAALRSIRLPEKFLFGRLLWPMPYQGLEVCLTWNKPRTS